MSPVSPDDNEICSLEQLRELLPKGVGSDDTKVVHRIDPHCRLFIERSPFLIIASRDADGAMDVSPKGDPPGFVQVLDEHTLLIPERPGNRRCDTFTNVLQVPDVALIFLVPGEDLTLRVMGAASITSNPELLRPLAVGDRVPVAALRIAVLDAFIHCGKAPKRAALWDPDRRVERGVFPRMGEMVHDQYRWRTGQDLPMTREELGAYTDADYRHRVY